MRIFSSLFFIFFYSVCLAQLPKGFVYVENFIPDLEVDLRYCTSNNFVGAPIDGYENYCLILTKEAAVALAEVQKELKKSNLSLKIYDGYRPQRAVNHFIRWARDLNDTINKSQFYPNVKKRNLFKEQYIASHSGHSKGSTLDVTIINYATKEVLDMGSKFDFFGKESWTNYPNLNKKQKKNRALLNSIMSKHGFRNYFREWWHFTLRKQPFPKTFFDFIIE